MIIAAWIGFIVLMVYGSLFLIAGFQVSILDSSAGLVFAVIGLTLLSIGIYAAPFNITFTPL